MRDSQITFNSDTIPFDKKKCMIFWIFFCMFSDLEKRQEKAELTKLYE